MLLVFGVRIVNPENSEREVRIVQRPSKESIDLSKAFARYQIMRCSSLYPKGKNTCASLIF